MSEIPKDDRCFFDPERVCHLRAAVSAIRAMDEAPENERVTVKEYTDTLQEMTLKLSRRDRKRFYPLVGPAKDRPDLRPGSCQGGPTHGVPLIGKMTCNAATIHYTLR